MITTKENLNRNPSPYAEVVESSLASFTAQCWQWDKYPAFGGLIEAGDEQEPVLGVVTEISTGSIEPHRHAFAYQKTEEELLEEQPQIFEFLKTTFVVHVVGHYTGKKIIYTLPSYPCKLHSFIRPSRLSIEQLFFESPNFLHLLFASQSITNIDELLLAIISQGAKKRLLTQPLLEQFSSLFSILTGNDYRRLKLFLRRAQELL